LNPSNQLRVYANRLLPTNAASKYKKQYKLKDVHTWKILKHRSNDPKLHSTATGRADSMGEEFLRKFYRKSMHFHRSDKCSFLVTIFSLFSPSPSPSPAVSRYEKKSQFAKIHEDRMAVLRCRWVVHELIDRKCDGWTNGRRRSRSRDTTLCSNIHIGRQPYLSVWLRCGRVSCWRTHMTYSAIDNSTPQSPAGCCDAQSTGCIRKKSRHYTFAHNSGKFKSPVVALLHPCRNRVQQV